MDDFYDDEMFDPESKKYGRYYDKKGEPISFMQWARGREEEKRVAETTLPNGTWISTVYFGLDMAILSWEKDHRPVIFETGVFVPGETGIVEIDRYCTEEEAEEGHRRMVEKWSRIN